jgi:hypothetical protein
MTPSFRPSAKVPCPLCQRLVGAHTDGDHLRLIKHLTPRTADAAATWCPASDRLVTRSASGQWIVEEGR